MLLYLLTHPDRFCGKIVEILVEQEVRQMGWKNLVFSIQSTHPEARQSTAAEQHKPFFYSSYKLNVRGEAIVIISLVLLYLLTLPDGFCVKIVLKIE